MTARSAKPVPGQSKEAKLTPYQGVPVLLTGEEARRVRAIPPGIQSTLGQTPSIAKPKKAKEDAPAEVE